MKRLLATLLVLLLSLGVAAGCNRGGGNISGSGDSGSGGSSGSDTGSGGSSSSEPVEEENEISFLSDHNFKNGIGIMGMDSSQGRKNFGYFDYEGTVDAEHDSVWQIGQWSGKSNLATNHVETKLADGVYDYRAGGKHVIVDTNEGKLTLGIDAELEYDHPRQAGENWVHNLIETNFTSNMNINDCEHIYAKMKFTLDKLEKKLTNAEFNKNLHNAQLLWYITVTNRPENTIYDNATGEWSRGRYGEYLWFGVPLWDAESLEIEQASSFDLGTSSYIWALGNRGYINVPVEVGDENEFKIDILPYMKEALNTVQSKGGLKNATYDNMYVGYMNLGWEVPGTYNVQATFDYFDITYVPKTK